MWEFYLCGCEIAFRREGHMVFQIQLATRQTAVPLTRDYITAFEAASTGAQRSSVHEPGGIASGAIAPACRAVILSQLLSVPRDPCLSTD